jgi:hypothetical protein
MAVIPLVFSDTLTCPFARRWPRRYQRRQPLEPLRLSRARPEVLRPTTIRSCWSAQAPRSPGSVTSKSSHAATVAPVRDPGEGIDNRPGLPPSAKETAGEPVHRSRGISSPKIMSRSVPESARAETDDPHLKAKQLLFAVDLTAEPCPSCVIVAVGTQSVFRRRDDLNF